MPSYEVEIAVEFMPLEYGENGEEESEQATIADYVREIKYGMPGDIYTDPKVTHVKGNVYKLTFKTDEPLTASQLESEADTFANPQTETPYGVLTGKVLRAEEKRQGGRRRKTRKGARKSRKTRRAF